MTRMMADISVAMCTFNGSKYIRQQISSIARQTVLPQEIIISDDGSTDGTLELARGIVSELTKEFPDFARVEVRFTFNPVGLGVTRNFEQAIAHTKQSFIILSDQDDEWLDDKIKVLEGEMRKSPHSALVFSDAFLVDEKGQIFGAGLFDALGLSSSERREILTPRAFRVLLRRNIVTGATSVISRELFELAAPFPEAWLHDEWLAMVAAVHDLPIRLVRPLIKYRQHGFNQVGVKKSTVSGKLEALRVERKVRNDRLLRRAEELQSRSEVWVIDASHRRLIQAKVQHEIARSRYPAAQAARLLPVVKEVLTLRYSQAGRGFRDVLRDLVQPS